jgi:hypothetical protein
MKERGQNRVPKLGIKINAYRLEIKWADLKEYP